MHPREIPASVIPWSVEAESGLIGGLLLDNSAWDQIADVVRADQFFDQRLSAIFAAISGLILSGKPADVLTVWDRLQQGGMTAGLEVQDLNELAAYMVSPATMRNYAEIVSDRAMMRGLMAAADEVRDIAVRTGITVEARLDMALGKLQDLQLTGVRGKPEPIQNFVVGFIDRLEALAEGRTKPGIPTRIPSLDRMLGGGIKPGKQIILAARPSVGKSSLAQQICLNLARDGHACAFLSQEMGKEELTDRAVANIGRVSLERIATGQLIEDEWDRVTEGVEALRNVPLYFDDQAALTLGDISAKARALKRQHDVKVIVLDYLQLCSSGKSGDSRHHQLEALSRGIKSLAKQLDLTFISLSQLNREVEKRASGRPALSDLKESGAIEEDADVVILLSRHGENKNGPKQIVCDLPKNRQGRVGELGLIFEGEYQRWTESAEPFQFKKAPSQHYTDDV